MPACSAIPTIDLAPDSLSFPVPEYIALTRDNSSLPLNFLPIIDSTPANDPPFSTAAAPIFVTASLATALSVAFAADSAAISSIVVLPKANLTPLITAVETPFTMVPPRLYIALGIANIGLNILLAKLPIFIPAFSNPP